MISYTIFRLVFSLLRLLEALIVVRALCSWFPQIQSSKVYDFVYTFTEPIIRPVRNVLSRIPGIGDGPLDFSSLGALLLLYALEGLLTAVFY